SVLIIGHGPRIEGAQVVIATFGSVVVVRKHPVNQVYAIKIFSKVNAQPIGDPGFSGEISLEIEFKAINIAAVDPSDAGVGGGHILPGAAGQYVARPAAVAENPVVYRPVPLADAASSANVNSCPGHVGVFIQGEVFRLHPVRGFVA